MFRVSPVHDFYPDSTILQRRVTGGFHSIPQYLCSSHEIHVLPSLRDYIRVFQLLFRALYIGLSNTKTIGYSTVLYSFSTRFKLGCSRQSSILTWLSCGPWKLLTILIGTVSLTYLKYTKWQQKKV